MSLDKNAQHIAQIIVNRFKWKYRGHGDHKQGQHAIKFSPIHDAKSKRVQEYLRKNVDSFIQSVDDKEKNETHLLFNTKTLSNKDHTQLTESVELNDVELLDEKVDLKSMKGPFPFVAGSGKTVDLYVDNSRTSNQWYIPQLKKFVDEKEAQKWLKSEDLKLKTKTGDDLPVMDSNNKRVGHIFDVESDNDWVPGGKQQSNYGFNFDDEHIMDSMSNRDRQYLNKNPQKVLAHMNKLFKKYNLSESNQLEEGDPLSTGSIISGVEQKTRNTKHIASLIEKKFKWKHSKKHSGMFQDGYESLAFEPIDDKKAQKVEKWLKKTFSDYDRSINYEDKNMTRFIFFKKSLETKDFTHITEQLKLQPKFAEKKGEFPVMDSSTAKGDNVGNQVATIKTSGDVFTFEFESDIDSRLTPKEKGYEHRNMQSVFKHVQKMYAKYSKALKEDNEPVYHFVKVDLKTPVQSLGGKSYISRGFDTEQEAKKYADYIYKADSNVKKTKVFKEGNDPMEKEFDKIARKLPNKIGPMKKDDWSGSVSYDYKKYDDDRDETVKWTIQFDYDDGRVYAGARILNMDSAGGKQDSGIIDEKSFSMEEFAKLKKTKIQKWANKLMKYRSGLEIPMSTTIIESKSLNSSEDTPMEKEFDKIARKLPNKIGPMKKSVSSGFASYDHRELYDDGDEIVEWTVQFQYYNGSVLAGVAILNRDSAGGKQDSGVFDEIELSLDEFAKLKKTKIQKWANKLMKYRSGFEIPMNVTIVEGKRPNSSGDTSMLEENAKKNRDSIKTYSQMETDDRGFLKDEQREDIEDLFALMKQMGHTKAPTTFKGLAVPPDIQSILNQRFSGKGSLSDVKTAKAPTSTKMKEDVAESRSNTQLREQAQPKGHGPGTVSLDQHQMIDDLFNLSKGMGRTKPLKTYKGIQLEGKFSDVLIAVQNKLDEYYEELAETRLNESKDRIANSYVDQISSDMGKVNATPKKKTLVESKKKAWKQIMRDLPNKIGKYKKKIVRLDEIQYSFADFSKGYEETKSIEIIHSDMLINGIQGNFNVYALYYTEENGYPDGHEIESLMNIPFEKLSVDKIKGWLKVLDKYNGHGPNPKILKENESLDGLIIETNGLDSKQKQTLSKLLKDIRFNYSYETPRNAERENKKILRDIRSQMGDKVADSTEKSMPEIKRRALRDKTAPDEKAPVRITKSGMANRTDVKSRKENLGTDYTNEQKTQLKKSLNSILKDLKKGDKFNKMSDQIQGLKDMIKSL